MTKTRDFTFNAGKQVLAATEILSKTRCAPSILTFHGYGSTATRHTIRYMLDYLSHNGHESICFEFSGNGDSSGNLEDSSLLQRQFEAHIAYDQLISNTLPTTLIGTSMGGYIAATLTPIVKPRTLILFCPANYHQRFSNLKFNTGLVKSGPYSESSAYYGIEAFAGNLLVIAGCNDQVVSKDTVYGYLEHAKQAANKKVIWLNDCDHYIHRWLPHQPNLLNEIQKEILNFITNDKFNK